MNDWLWLDLWIDVVRVGNNTISVTAGTLLFLGIYAWLIGRRGQ